MSGHAFDVSRFLGREPSHFMFASRLARLATFRGFAGEYFRLPVEASQASCNRVESSSMAHSFPLQGWNGDLNQSGFISRKALAVSQWGQPALTNAAISGVGSAARTCVLQKNMRKKTDRPSCRVSPAGLGAERTNLVLTRIIHEPSAGRLTGHFLDVLFKDASEPRGSVCPSRNATTRFLDEPS